MSVLLIANAFRRAGMHLPGLLLWLLLVTAPNTHAQVSTSLIGIDHMPVAVRDLDGASASFRKLGFTIKPGRLHDNSIRNNHVKFVDGSGIELITAQARKDALSSSYVDHLTRGEGPTAISFHARDTDKLIIALKTEGIAHERSGDIVSLKDPRLDFIFITRDNRSPTDRPKHFTHANGAFAMKEVWIATDDADPLRQLLKALGSVPTNVTVDAPMAVEAQVFIVQYGRIVLLPASHQLIKGRPVIGAVMATRSATQNAKPSSSTRILTPAEAHGMWLVLSSQPSFKPLR